MHIGPSLVKHFGVIELKTSRRGRPKIDRPKIDLGTPELQAKRLAASPHDATLSTTPLDVIKARGIISDEAHTAATYFAALRKIVFGKAHPGAIDLTAISGIADLPDEKRSAETERLYRDACSAMKHYSRAAFDAVENLVIHERWPAWLTARTKAQQPRDHARFTLGIAALLGWYKGHHRKAA